MSEPFLVETRSDIVGSWVERWMCQPPDAGVAYQVIRQEWGEDYEVRTILEIRISQ